MNQPPAKLYRIREGKLNEWRNWCQQMYTELRVEASATLMDENVAEEFFLTFQIDQTWYTLGTVITNDGQEPKSATPKDLNRRHREKIRACLEPVGHAEFSYFLTSKD